MKERVSDVFLVPNVSSLACLNLTVSWKVVKHYRLGSCMLL